MCCAFRLHKEGKFTSTDISVFYYFGLKCYNSTQNMSLRSTSTGMAFSFFREHCIINSLGCTFKVCFPLKNKQRGGKKKNCPFQKTQRPCLPPFLPSPPSPPPNGASAVSLIPPNSSGRIRQQCCHARKGWSQSCPC